MNREPIDDGEKVSRLVEYPSMFDKFGKCIYREMFTFPERDCESLVWRKYASRCADVHELGFQKAEKKQQRKNTNIEYKGFFTASAGEIRSLSLPIENGGTPPCPHKFKVEHAPSEEEGIHHTHVCFFNSETGVTEKPEGPDTKKIRRYLKSILAELFAKKGLCAP